MDRWDDREKAWDDQEKAWDDQEKALELHMTELIFLGKKNLWRLLHVLMHQYY